MEKYKIDAIQNIPDLLKIRNEWNCLWEKSKHRTPYQRWEWIDSWIRANNQQTAIHILTARLYNGKLIGIAPFLIKYSSIFNEVKSFYFIGQEASIYPNFLIQENCTYDVLHMFVEHLESRFKNIALVFILADPNSSSESLLSILKKKNWYRIEKKVYTNRLIIPVGSDYERYLLKLSKKMRQEIRGETRKLSKQYKLEFFYSDRFSNLEQQMQILFDLNSKKWGGNPKKSHMAHRECYRSFQKDDTAKLFFLTCDKKNVGALSTFLIGDTLFAEVAGFDYSVGRFDLGKVFYNYVFSWAVIHGYRYIDFSSGDENYKFRYKPEKMEKYVITACNNSFSSSFFKKYSGIARRMDEIKKIIQQSQLLNYIKKVVK